MIEEIKQKAIEALGKIDVEKLTLFDLETFTRILGNLSDNNSYLQNMCDNILNTNQNKHVTIGELSTKEEK